jgi:hypothetical protein
VADSSATDCQHRSGGTSDNPGSFLSPDQATHAKREAMSFFDGWDTCIDALDELAPGL